MVYLWHQAVQAIDLRNIAWRTMAWSFHIHPFTIKCSILPKQADHSSHKPALYPNKFISFLPHQYKICGKSTLGGDFTGSTLLPGGNNKASSVIMAYGQVVVVIFTNTTVLVCMLGRYSSLFCTLLGSLPLQCQEALFQFRIFLLM